MQERKINVLTRMEPFEIYEDLVFYAQLFSHHASRNLQLEEFSSNFHQQQQEHGQLHDE
jgi:hypothetical protein